MGSPIGDRVAPGKKAAHNSMSTEAQSPGRSLTAVNQAQPTNPNASQDASPDMPAPRSEGASPLQVNFKNNQNARNQNSSLYHAPSFGNTDMGGPPSGGQLNQVHNFMGQNKVNVGNSPTHHQYHILQPHNSANGFYHAGPANLLPPSSIEDDWGDRFAYDINNKVELKDIKSKPDDIALTAPKSFQALEHLTTDMTAIHQRQKEFAFDCPQQDNTIPRTSRQQAYVVKKVVNAIANIVPDTVNEDLDANKYKSRWNSQARYHHPVDIVTTAWDLVNDIIKVHTEGWTTPVRDRLSWERVQMTQHLTFKQRMTLIISLLSFSKTTCDLLLKSEKTWLIIGCPHHFEMQARGNQPGNRKRALRDKKAREEEKEKRKREGEAQKQGSAKKMSPTAEAEARDDSEQPASVLASTGPDNYPFNTNSPIPFQEGMPPQAYNTEDPSQTHAQEQATHEQYGSNYPAVPEEYGYRDTYYSHPSAFLYSQGQHQGASNHHDQSPHPGNTFSGSGNMPASSGVPRHPVQSPNPRTLLASSRSSQTPFGLAAALTAVGNDLNTGSTAGRAANTASGAVSHSSNMRKRKHDTTDGYNQGTKGCEDDAEGEDDSLFDDVPSAKSTLSKRKHSASPRQKRVKLT